MQIDAYLWSYIKLKQVDQIPQHKSLYTEPDKSESVGIVLNALV